MLDLVQYLGIPCEAVYVLDSFRQSFAKILSRLRKIQKANVTSVPALYVLRYNAKHVRDWQYHRGSCKRSAIASTERHCGEILHHLENCSHSRRRITIFSRRFILIAPPNHQNLVHLDRSISDVLLKIRTAPTFFFVPFISEDNFLYIGRKIILIAFNGEIFLLRTRVKILQQRRQ